MDNSNHRGFTFIEVLISFSIVTFLLLGTSQLIIRSLLIKKSAETNLAIAALASSKLEFLKSFPYESNELKEGFYSESLKDESTQESFLREWKIEDILANLKKIEIDIVSKTNPNKKNQIVLFISRELGF